MEFPDRRQPESPTADILIAVLPEGKEKGGGDEGDVLNRCDLSISWAVPLNTGRGIDQGPGAYVLGRLNITRCVQETEYTQLRATPLGECRNGGHSTVQCSLLVSREAHTDYCT